jgi:hypothetical protein
MNMLRRRFWFEVGASMATATLLLLTLIQPDWIERFLKVEPDGGGGETEWAVVAILGLATVALLVMARFEWTRLRPASR